MKSLQQSPLRHPEYPDYSEMPREKVRAVALQILEGDDFLLKAFTFQLLDTAGKEKSEEGSWHAVMEEFAYNIIALVADQGLQSTLKAMAFHCFEYEVHLDMLFDETTCAVIEQIFKTSRSQIYYNACNRGHRNNTEIMHQRWIALIFATFHENWENKRTQKTFAAILTAYHQMESPHDFERIREMIKESHGVLYAAKLGRLLEDWYAAKLCLSDVLNARQLAAIDYWHKRFTHESTEPDTEE